MQPLYRRKIKRALDFGLSLIGIIVTSPLFGIVALAIKLDDRGPVLFRQQRIGRCGREFTMIKFRSMHVGTRELASSDLYLPSVTRVGALIRRTNIDELPQLLNILNGDMSIVGPRPCLTTQDDVIHMRTANGSIEIRPGLTGWAQVQSYDGMQPAEKCFLDGQYLRRIDFETDVKIIARTLAYLLKPPPRY